MKILPYLASLIVISLLSSCDKKSESLKEPKRTIIAGRLSNIPKDDKGLYKNVYIETKDFSSETGAYRADVKADGSFTIYIDQYIAQDVELHPAREILFLHPGDSVFVDVVVGGETKLSGDIAETNDIQEYINDFAFESFGDADHKIGKLDDANYQTYCINVRDKMLKERNAFISKTKPSEDLKLWTKNQIYIQYYEALYKYAMGRHVIRTRGNWNTPAFMREGKDYDEIFNASVMNSGAYGLVKKYYWFFIPTKVMDWSRSEEARSMKDPLVHEKKANELLKLALENKPEVLKQMILGMHSYKKLVSNDTTNVNLADSTVREPFLLKPLEAFYTNTVRHIENPVVASNAILKVMENTPGTELIKNILAENAGKVIYLDIWATWCKPCIAQFPAIEKMKEKFKSQDVSIVSICLRSSKPSWQAVLSKHNLAGFQVFGDKDQTLAIERTLKMRGYPHFILIDKKGNITESGPYLVPAAPLTSRKIEELIKKG